MTTRGRILPDRYGLSAFLIYLAFSILFFGRTLFGHFSTLSIGQSSDPGSSVWCLVWLPYAIAHRINPFFYLANLGPDRRQSRMEDLHAVGGPSVVALK